MNIHMLETYNKRKDEIWRLDRLILSRHRTPILKNNKINLPEEVMGGGMLEEIFKISLYLPCPVHSTKFLIIAHKLHEPLSFFNDSSCILDDEIIKKAQILHQTNWIDVRAESLVGDFISTIASVRHSSIHIEKSINDWTASNPAGLQDPRDALSVISDWEEKFSHFNDDRIKAITSEFETLKPALHNLTRIIEQIDEQKQKQWLTINEANLDGLLTKMRNMPSRVTQYDSYKNVKKLLKDYSKANVLVVKLKSQALKDRHWKQLTKKMGVTWNLNDLTLGHFWDINLLSYESIIKDIVMVAQGEKALEEYLIQVGELWRNYKIELVNYQNKCQIICGWNDLFNKLKEHINGVSAMKLSPYYKDFEEEALSWEDKLNRISSMLDVWIDVQRRWVYLDGIFEGSADIKYLLPNETKKFQNVCSEFLELMRKVSKNTIVLEILNIQRIKETLEKLVSLLSKIQKALGEYLECERSHFPRFYFVGDEDLLEIIGSSKNVPQLNKHFKKMFAGVYSLQLNDDNTIVLGIASKEGEEVIFKNPVSIAANPKINDWLTLVEKEIRITLASILYESVTEAAQFHTNNLQRDQYLSWVEKYQAQLVVLSAQIAWSELVENALKQLESDPSLIQSQSDDKNPLQILLINVQNTLKILTDSVLQDQQPIRRRKLEHLIIEHVRQRDSLRELINKKISSSKSFDWLSQMRFYFDPKVSLLKQLSIHMAYSKFHYGFEYLGVQDKLVQTPLTDRCYLTMTQALEAKLGGSPFGPAGTGKTESVKALGHQLGRFVVVFNCNEAFDFQAMGRIFVGLCQTGAWGCFDEFNRLEEGMLSAVSQQIQTIQEALKGHQQIISNHRQQGDTQKKQNETISIELVGKKVLVNPHMAIFITMNPGYAGRSNLPDNLKKLFRSMAMTQPDNVLIAQVKMYSQGFRTAEKLAHKIVPFFKLCNEQLSTQNHYDFGLRSLKSVLVMAGNLKRKRIQIIREKLKEENKFVDEGKIAENLNEQEILMQSIMESFVPRLINVDLPLLQSILNNVFPGVKYEPLEIAGLKDEIKKVCHEMHFVYGGSDENTGSLWLEKVLQLYSISNLNHGLMMVGPSGSGKSTTWRVLLKALERYENVEGVAHIIDPKAISKDALYGSMDQNTREWTDGLFTHILRKIINNVRGELNKRQWIIFDGDVDPEWVENLNSVLDDNKLLTLPNGERLNVPPNVRIMFEVHDLKYATLATISRCGMIWFSENILTIEMVYENYFKKLCNNPLEVGDDKYVAMAMGATITATTNIKLKKRSKTPKSSCSDPAQTHSDFSIKNTELSTSLIDQRLAASYLRPFFTIDGIVTKCLEYASKFEHIMDFTRLRALGSMFTMLNQCVRNVIVYNKEHDFRLGDNVIEKYLTKSLVLAILWSFSGDCRHKFRCDLGKFIMRSSTTIPMPSDGSQTPIIDFEVQLTTGEWSLWLDKVSQVQVEIQRVAAPDVVVPTIDTIRHENLLFIWLSEHKPLLLCGPPGSGKTMTLFAALRSLPNSEVVGLNFSSTTTPELILKTFDHYCEYKRTSNKIVLSPIQLDKRLFIFCDEINLPDEDKYGTQRVISFIRQCIEHGGFYRSSDQSWVKLERIQFVGACNPPTDPGRKPLSDRFLRHVPLVYVDYPGELSLKQIYGTFNRAMLSKKPNLRNYAEPLTNAMVEFYLLSLERFTLDQQPHYIYSPREMTRWVRGIYESIHPLEHPSVEDLVRLYVHEALRLFQDRLVTDEERQWTDENINTNAMKHFTNMNSEAALKRPILYSNWLKKDYLPVDQEELREYVKKRLKEFNEKELEVSLVLFNEVLDHVLRIDRIFRQPQGHLLLIGVSGTGKTTLSRFVAWINGFSAFQLKIRNNYKSEDFDDDLRNVLRRSGTKGEKIVFIVDESNVLDSGFLERMNTLLANGEVPGLFEGDEYSKLITQCKEGVERDGLILHSSEELYKWFTNEVMRNLHVVFTMNSIQDGLRNRASTSPALFNRCVINWFGDWSHHSYYQVGRELTLNIDLEKSDYQTPDTLKLLPQLSLSNISHREAVVSSFVQIHDSMHQANHRLQKKDVRTTTITPRHYLDFINHFVKLYNEKRSELDDQQVHLNTGLFKINETVEQVEELQKSLTVKRNELEKNNEANSKLNQMNSDQKEAEKEKVTFQELERILKEQSDTTKNKKQQVSINLEEVESAVLEAQNAVNSIKKQDLVELRAMVNPPRLVKLALELVCLVLNVKTNAWPEIRAVTFKENFMSAVIDSKTNRISPSIKEKMTSIFLSNPDYNFDNVNKSSKACGPLVIWVTAKIKYSDLLDKVASLKNELDSLEQAAETNQIRAAELKENLNKLEESIARYKQEYTELISEAQKIKSDLNKVEGNVARSVALLNSLSNEKTRWKSSSESFKVQMSTIVGDVVLSSALMAYGGYYDQDMRNSLFNTWISNLQDANIKFKEDLTRIQYLSNADERMKWHASSLPTDDFCIENAIMLKRFNRYPLIIDPSRQATEFIMNMYKDRKITKTSFLDNSFRRDLESALRFGNPILIQDVENYDPILNPVLDREISRADERVLITLGDEEIDFSPMFTMFLSTRDPTFEIPPNICSRVTYVNFKITRASLEAQCLYHVLKFERPDVEEKRLNLLKVQGEFQQRLRHLEKDLLRSLNESKGKILEDNEIVSRLENLKKEASEISEKVTETDRTMKEVQTVINQYSTLSQVCSSIYFTMEVLNQINSLYQYSLQYFLEIFNTVLTSNSNLKDVKDSQERLKIIAKDIFHLAYYRIARGMLHDDRIVLGLLFSKIYLKGFSNLNSNEESSLEQYFRLLINSNKTSIVRQDYLNRNDKHNSLDAEQSEALLYLSKTSQFSSLSSQIHSDKNEFFEWVESTNPESNTPEKYWLADMDSSSVSSSIGLSQLENSLRKLLIIKVFRPDRFKATAEMFVSSIFGEDFLQQAENMLDLANIVENEIKAVTPILMCSVAGFDASGRVEDLASETNKQLISIAIGSSEGYTQAEKTINNSSKIGRWVLLKNLHLAPQWHIQLEKILQNLQAHPAFRIFLSMEINQKIPSNLLRLGRCFVFEPPPGIKANLERTISVIPESRMNKAPTERSHLYFLLSWLHAIIQERLRYIPLGWSKTYEFNESDLKYGLDTIDVWIDSLALGSLPINLPLNKVPFNALFTLMSECVYGGKIDNTFDRRLLNTFLKQLFCVDSFKNDFKLVSDGLFNLDMPDANRREKLWEWIDNLKHQQTPSWLGLPNSAEKVLLSNNCREIINKLLKLSILDEENYAWVYGEQQQQQQQRLESNIFSGGDSRPAWMKQLLESVTGWLYILPKSLSRIRHTKDNTKDPLFRFFEREINTGISLLKTVLDDLNDVVSICDGHKKQTNHHRQLLKDLAKGLIPRNWRRYTLPKNLTVQPWIVDFAERIKQMSQIASKFFTQNLSSLKNHVVWLGGLFTPEAYITATGQYVAQKNSWSLEELVLDITVYKSVDEVRLDDFSFGITGLKLQGAKFENNKIHLSLNIVNDLPVSVIRWSKSGTITSANSKMSKINLPVYLNASRSELLLTIHMDTDQIMNLFFMRGVAIYASNLC